MSQEVLLFDSHCHLDDERFDPDRDQLISSLPKQGIFACLTCGSDLATSEVGIDLSKRYDHVWAAVGIHPHEAGKAEESDLLALPGMLKEEKVVALGEIGLDFYYNFSPRDVQIKLLNQQLDLAYGLNIPVILHVREAHGAMLDLMRSRKNRLPKGVLHCFSGSAESAMEYESLGFYISFAGSVTFKKAEQLRRSAKAVDLDRLLIETDSPYLAPVPERGKRNDPSKVAHVCKVLADLRNIDEIKMARLTRDNACRLFGVPRPREN